MLSIFHLLNQVNKCMNNFATILKGLKIMFIDRSLTPGLIMKIIIYVLDSKARFYKNIKILASSSVFFFLLNFENLT